LGFARFLAQALEEIAMRSTAITAALAFGLLSGTPAYSASETTDLHVPPQTRVDVREWVVKNKPRAYRFKEPIVVGATIPSDVQTMAVPEAWGSEVRPYHYAYSDNRVYLVEPTSRRVVYIID
jgi:hypothetical protein